MGYEFKVRNIIGLFIVILSIPVNLFLVRITFIYDLHHYSRTNFKKMWNRLYDIV
jgi:hypothetical protein